MQTPSVRAIFDKITQHQQQLLAKVAPVLSAVVSAAAVAASASAPASAPAPPIHVPSPVYSPSSPYSPGSSEGDDLFEPPPDNSPKKRSTLFETMFSFQIT
jgi:hypothetical protein